MKTPTKTYKRNRKNNNDEDDNSGNSRQQLPRTCKGVHPSYVIDLMNDDVEDHDSSKKKTRGYGSCSNTKQVQVPVPRITNPFLTEKERDDKEDGSNEITVLSWLIDMNVVREFDYVRSYHGTEVKGFGLVRRSGVICGCCCKLCTVPDFLYHSTQRTNVLSNPYEKVLVNEACASVLTCMIEAWNRHSVAAKSGYQHVQKRFKLQDDYDDCCMICADGGNLICCDNCPNTYHPDCIGFQGVPNEVWHCPYCRCIYCDAEYGHGLLLTCFQCSKKYHGRCVEFANQNYSGVLPSSVPFCGRRCWMVYQNLEEKLGKRMPLQGGYSWTLEEKLGKRMPLQGKYSWTLVRRMDLDGARESNDNLHLKAYCNTMVALAAKLMNESFDRIVDRQTRSNMIETVVYSCGSNYTRTNFSRFYTAILDYNGSIITAASLRIPSPKIAEIPFIATLERWQNKGMCRSLLGAIRSTLSEMGVEHIIIPSADEMVESWKTKFRFTPLDKAKKREIMKLNILMFPKTTRLQIETKQQPGEAQVKSEEAEGSRRVQKDKTRLQRGQIPPRRPMVVDLNLTPEP